MKEGFRITISEVKRKYLLDDDDVSDLECLKKRNPRNPRPTRGNMMRLYLLDEVKARAIDKYGSLGAIDDILSKRANKMQVIRHRRLHKLMEATDSDEDSVVELDMMAADKKTQFTYWNNGMNWEPSVDILTNFITMKHELARREIPFETDQQDIIQFLFFGNMTLDQLIDKLN